MVTGTVVLDFQRTTGPNVAYENAELTPETDGEFHLEISSEFLTAKLGQSNGAPMEGRLTPFIRSHQRMSHERYADFEHRVKQFSYQARHDWPKVRRLNELWLNRRLDLLASDIREFLPVERFPMSNELECHRGVSALTRLFLSPLIETNERDRMTKTIRKIVFSANSTVRDALTEGAGEAERRGLLRSIDERRLLLTSSIVDKFSCLVPALSLRFFRNRADLNLEEEGATTAGFDDLRQFFIDGFELVADIQLLSTLWNNVVHRGHWDKMVARRKDVVTFDSFAQKKKGERVQFLDKGETFDWLPLPAKDSRLRNALAHGSARYDPKTQVVLYYPKGSEDPADEQRIYIVELAEKCLELFGAAELATDVLVATRHVLRPGWIAQN